MLRNAFLLMGLIALASVNSASAAVVNFRGVLTSNPISGGTLSLPLNNFEARIITGVPFGTSAFITGGFFNFNGTLVNVVGGQVQIPSAGTLSFTVLSPSNVISTFSFAGVSGLGSTVNQSAFDSLGPPARPTALTTAFSIFQSDGGSNILASYDGSISSVPEPNSMIALTGLIFGAGAWRLRRRKLRAAV